MEEPTDEADNSRQPRKRRSLRQCLKDISTTKLLALVGMVLSLTILLALVLILVIAVPRQADLMSRLDKQDVRLALLGDKTNNQLTIINEQDTRIDQLELRISRLEGKR